LRRKLSLATSSISNDTNKPRPEQAVHLIKQPLAEPKVGERICRHERAMILSSAQPSRQGCQTSSKTDGLGTELLPHEIEVAFAEQSVHLSEAISEGAHGCNELSRYTAEGGDHATQIGADGSRGCFEPSGSA
jgi:hypothetical protein